MSEKSPLTPEETPYGRLNAAFGIVAEHITAKPEVAKAVMTVLGYEQNRIQTRALVELPADMAHAQHCFADGKREGLDRAALALLDGAYIRDVREVLEEEMRTTGKE